jgi:hypothetical protein
VVNKLKKVLKITLFTVLGLFVILLLIGIFSDGGKEDGSTDNAAPAAAKETKNKPTISKSEFDALQIGMSYEDATTLIGGPGDVQSESGKKGGTGLEIHTILYGFKGEGSVGANASLMFQDGKLMNKSQAGLK